MGKGLVWGGVCAFAVCCSLSQEVPLRETPEGRLFGTDAFAVRLDAGGGWAGEVVCDGRTVVEPAGTRQAFDIRHDGKWVTGSGSHIETLGVERAGADTLKIRQRVGDWSVDTALQVFPDKRMVRRWFEITWRGASDTKIRGFWAQGGELLIGPKGGYFCPAHYPPSRVGASELTEGRRAHGNHGVIGETGDGWSAVWMTDQLPAYADRGGEGATESAGRIRVSQSFEMCGYAHSGVTQKVGDAWLWLQPNDAETALRRMAEWFRQVGHVPPADRPEWLKRAVLYSFHPGGTIGSNCKDLGGFSAATAFLPRIAEIGCNAIWLMPLEDQSIYCPRDYYAFQQGLGTAAEYKTLTATAHALGLHVWQDCVPHGGRNDCPRAKAHPEWLAQNEDGTTLPYWCFDFNWPSWCDYMRGVAAFYTREYGLDGFRIDAVGGSHIPNWNPAIPYARASLSQSQGGFAMQRAIRSAVKSVRPDGATLAEVGEDVFGATSDAVYDFDLCYNVLHDFRRTPPKVFAARLRRWLHEQQCAETPDLIRLRHVESHDSLRSGLWYGVDAQRALAALLAWIPGLPLVYHEMETGSEDALRQIYRIRRSVAELNAGTADYLCVSAPAGVFACLRTGVRPEKGDASWSDEYAWDRSPRKSAQRASIVLVNLNGRPVRGVASVPPDALPEAVRGASWARDLVSGERAKCRRGAVEFSLPPFGYTVLRFESRALPEAEALRAVSCDRAARRPPDNLRVKGGNGALWICPATGLATAWESGGLTLAADMDLLLPPDAAALGTNVVCTQKDGVVEAVRVFGARTLTLRYAPSDGGVSVEAAWRGGVPQDAALVVRAPGAERWFARTAEGDFAGPFNVRHAAFDGAEGSIYRLPQGTAVLWNSRLHPFGVSDEAAQVGAESDGRRVSFVFDAGRLPASVRLLDRIGASHGLRVAVAWSEHADDVQSGGDRFVFRFGAEKAKAVARRADAGDGCLREAGGGWTFENGHYRAWISRSGVLMGLWRKTDAGWREAAQRSRLYTDHGFGADKTFTQEDDVEATARIERDGDGSLTLRFWGELRGFYRFDKMARPIRFYSDYTFGGGAAFRRTVAFDPLSDAAGDFAYLALLSRVEGADRVTFADAGGVFLSGARGDGKTRVAQTARSADPGRLPREIRVAGTNGVPLICLSDLVWTGKKPANVFLHGDDLHMAWLDGPPVGGEADGAWRGVSMSVACEQDADVAAQTPVPLVAQTCADGVLRDGDFESACGQMSCLLLSKTVVPSDRPAHADAWRLPPAAALVDAGGSRCVEIVGDGREFRLVSQSLPTASFAGGSTWRLTARMRGAGVQKGDAEWKTACLRWVAQVKGQSVFATASLPFGDSDWRTLSVDLTVPSGVRNLQVEAGLNGNAGHVWVDNVRIEEIKKPSP